MSKNAANPENNGAVLTIAKIIKNVMTSAAHAEIGALYINSRQAIPAQTTVEEMGHKQPPTPIKTDNTTSLIFFKPPAKSNQVNVHETLIHA